MQRLNILRGKHLPSTPDSVPTVSRQSKYYGSDKTCGRLFCMWVCPRQVQRLYRPLFLAVLRLKSFGLSVSIPTSVINCLSSSSGTHRTTPVASSGSEFPRNAARHWESIIGITSTRPCGPVQMLRAPRFCQLRLFDPSLVGS